jgi:hypothetical protein
MEQRLVSNTSFRKSGLVYLLALFTFISQYSSFYGEDIVNARNDYLTGKKIDFWGGVSTLAYSHIPSIGLRWQVWLGILQISLTALGLQKLLGKKNESRIPRIFTIFAIYIALLFSSQMTRDGLMFSLLIFGIALLVERLSKRAKSLGLLAPLVVITFGMSFRPWISFALIPIVIFIIDRSSLRFSRVSKLALIVTISILPILTEYTISKSLGLVKSYPEQQVMLMDSAASYCYTNNPSTGAQAERALKLFSTNPKFPNTACQLFRPDTWVSLTSGRNTSSKGISSDFTLIQAGEKTKYRQLRTGWIEMVTSDPVTYFQNKIIFAGKLIIGSDSRNISFLNQTNTLDKVRALYRAPYDVSISLHLFSLMATIILIVLSPLSRYIRRKTLGVEFDALAVSLISAISFWVCLSSIAYIGSNGRYTYSISIISMLLLITYRSRKVLAGATCE